MAHEYGYTKGDATINNHSGIIELPHSCDAWEIGDTEDALALIDDLRELIAELSRRKAKKFEEANNDY